MMVDRRLQEVLKDRDAWRHETNVLIILLLLFLSSFEKGFLCPCEIVNKEFYLNFRSSSLVLSEVTLEQKQESLAASWTFFWVPGALMRPLQVLRSDWVHTDWVQGHYRDRGYIRT